MNIGLRGRYCGFLSSVEHSPCADVWMSSPDPAKTTMRTVDLPESRSAAPIPVAREYWESVASQGCMRIVNSEFRTSVVLDWEKDSVPADTAIHVQVFVELDEEALGYGRLGLVPAGSAHVHLSDLLAGEVVMPIIHQSLQDESAYSGTADTQKGVIVLALENPEDLRVKFLAPGSSDLLQKNGERIRNLMQRVIHSRSARATRMEGFETFRMRSTLPEMAGVRAEDYATPAGINVLDEEFFSLSNVPEPSEPTVWMYMRRAATVRGWDVGRLGTALRKVVATPRPWPVEMYQAQEMFVHGLTMLATAIYYSSDYAVVHSRGVPTLTIVESFDDAMRRGVADCEDFAKLISVIFLFIRDRAAAAAPWQADIQYFARAFVCVVTLRSVCSSALDHVAAGGPGRPVSMRTPTRTDQVGAHMHVVLLPIHYFHNCAERAHKSFPAVSAPVCAKKPSPSAALAPLYCEGTGPMSPFLVAATEYLGEGGEAYQKMQAAADHVLMHPNTSMISRFIQSCIRTDVPPPDALRFLRRARTIALRKMLPMDSPHNFYRMAGDGFVPGMDIGTFDDGGRRATLRKFTYMYKQDDAETRGVPALEEAGSSDRVGFMFFGSPDPAVDEITRRVRCHLPPMRRVDAASKPDDFDVVAREIEDVFMHELGDAAYKRVDLVSDTHVPGIDEDGTAVVLHRFARTGSLTTKRVCSVANLVRMNPSIVEVSIETVVLGPGAWQTDFVFKVIVPPGMENSVVMD